MAREFWWGMGSLLIIRKVPYISRLSFLTPLALPPSYWQQFNHESLTYPLLLSFTPVHTYSDYNHQSDIGGHSQNKLTIKGGGLGFGYHPHTPRGPHGVPTPIPHGGGELSLKNPGGGGFWLKPHGVLVGFFMHFYAFHAGNFFIFVGFCEKKCQILFQ